MKILIINKSFSKGGAAKAANRITEAIAEYDNSNDIKFISDKDLPLYSFHKPINKTLFSKLTHFFRILIDYIPRKLLTNLYYGRYSFWFIGKNLKKVIEQEKPDIVHFHWINEGFISPELFEYLSKKNIPYVVTMHDSWYFTGGCHSPFECENYKIKCYYCPQVKWDGIFIFALKQMKIKNDIFNNLSTKKVFVAPSVWLKNLALSSKVLKFNNVINIPNPIKNDDYTNISKIEARKSLGLDNSKKYFIYIAAAKDKNKGFDLFVEAAKKIKDEKIAFLIVGPTIELDNSVHYKNFGYIKDEKYLQTIFAAADFTVVPSRQENLSNVIMESLACGTPVIAFNIGGNGDMIVDNYNGLLINDLSADSLAKAIENAAKFEQYEVISSNAKTTVKEKFDYPIVAKQYLDVYKNLMEKKDG